MVETAEEPPPSRSPRCPSPSTGTSPRRWPRNRTTRRRKPTARRGRSAAERGPPGSGQAHQEGLTATSPWCRHNPTAARRRAPARGQEEPPEVSATMNAPRPQFIPTLWSTRQAPQSLPYSGCREHSPCELCTLRDEGGAVVAEPRRMPPPRRRLPGRGPCGQSTRSTCSGRVVPRPRRAQSDHRSAHAVQRMSSCVRSTRGPGDRRRSGELLG